MTIEPIHLLYIFSNIIGLTFGYAALSKMASLRAFSAAFNRQISVPPRAAFSASLALVLGESVIAVAQIGKVSLEYWAPVTVLLLVVFLAFSFRKLATDSPKAPCLCFGVDESESIGPNTVVRLAVLTLLAISVVWLIFVGNVDPARQSTVSGTQYLELGVASVLGLLVGNWLLSFPEMRVVLRVYSRR